MTEPTLTGAVTAVLAVAVLLACARLVWASRAGALPRTATWWALLLLQPLVAGLLYLSLFPPTQARRSDTLVLLTADATAAQVAAHRADGPVLALPEAAEFAAATRVPDLATALRRQPATARLLVLGAGLVARDRDALRGQALAFEPAPLPRGVIELWSPTQIALGLRWPVSGRVNALPGGSVELLDPAGGKTDATTLDGSGHFLLHGDARAPGRAVFTLRMRDARGRVVQQLSLSKLVLAAAQPRVMILAGGPGPELKYLRRWATDAGARLHTQISVGAGLRLGDAPLRFDAATLRGFDLLILDERAWRGLGASGQAALREALHGGLGVLLRITGPLTAAERSQLATLGFDVQAATVSRTVLLPERFTALPLSRQPLRVRGSEAGMLLRGRQGEALAVWRAAGQGRLGLWWLADSYQLVLAGHASAHGQLWSEALATLARATVAAPPWLREEDPRPQQRLFLCGLQATAQVETPDGKRTPLLVQAPVHGTRCAAYWPRQAGWHRVGHGDNWLAFVVRASDQAPGIAARVTAEQTRLLLSDGSRAATRVASASSPGRRWPWFLAWLALAGLCAWLERRWWHGRA